MEGISPIDPRMRPIEPIVSGIQHVIDKELGKSTGDAFQNMLVEEIDNLAGLQKNAGDLIKALALGQNVDLNDVVLAVEKADLSMRFALQLRNKVLEAYQEVTRLPV
jgi:flagellar hook-basal body complex protein FliE